MSVQALGYIGLRAKDLGDWATFGSDFLGLQRIDKTRASMAFRMDDRKQRVIIDADGGQGIGYFGWEVADASAMAALAAKLCRWRNPNAKRCCAQRFLTIRPIWWSSAGAPRSSMTSPTPPPRLSICSNMPTRSCLNSAITTNS